ncbi:hypothetical protein B0H11DRAFT_1923877 [Mycena galericulata]|nr:hypothetical protein B0H11DRAFT_1923877 [Mycena galericulata]
MTMHINGAEVTIEHPAWEMRALAPLFDDGNLDYAHRDARNQPARVPASGLYTYRKCTGIFYESGVELPKGEREVTRMFAGSRAVTTVFQQHDLMQEALDLWISQKIPRLPPPRKGNDYQRHLRPDQSINFIAPTLDLLRLYNATRRPPAKAKAIQWSLAHKDSTCKQYGSLIPRLYLVTAVKLATRRGRSLCPRCYIKHGVAVGPGSRKVKDFMQHLQDLANTIGNISEQDLVLAFWRRCDSYLRVEFTRLGYEAEIISLKLLMRIAEREEHVHFLIEKERKKSGKKSGGKDGSKKEQQNKDKVAGTLKTETESEETSEEKKTKEEKKKYYRASKEQKDKKKEERAEEAAS